MILNNAPRRVVISGLGMVTPLGNTAQSTWASALQGQSGVVPIDQFDTSDFNTKICAPVKGFDPLAFMLPKEARKCDLFVQYALAATHEAMHDAGIEVSEKNASRIGVCIGSGVGGLTNIEASCNTLMARGSKRVSPMFVPSAIINSASGWVSIKYGFKGPNLALATACASGTHGIALAAQQIANGYSDMMFCGGAEMAISPLGVAGFSALRALSANNTHPQEASRPWDKDRDGFVLGAGAGVLVLECLEHAKARGAQIYAELTGCGFSSDASHITAPDENAEGAISCMKQALNDAKLNADDVDYINAHATSTSIGDAAEVTAIKSVFDDHKRLLVSSTKSMHGHLLGAAGAVEAAICALAIRDQKAPPTINLDQPDDGFDLNFVPHVAVDKKLDVCLSNSFGFGGTNGCLILQRL